MNASITDTDNRENGFMTLINRLRANPKLPLLVAASSVIAVVVALLLWTKRADYQVLYSHLGDRDGGDIVTELVQLNIPYRFTENGGALLIPAEKVHETRLRLAQKGLPKGGSVGFELLDNEKFGISQFGEQINYQRALEGELARTIATLGPVQQARVHLALPKQSLFIREQKSPTASITLLLQPGRALDDGQINAITHMVSGSVAGLPLANVTIVDQSGNLLTQSQNSGRGLSATQLKFVNEVESRYQRRIEAILLPVLGAGNVHAEVTAQLDFATREQTIEEYKPNQPPNQAAIRSQQLSESDQTGLANGGVPGALSNTPNAQSVAPIEIPPPAGAKTSPTLPGTAVAAKTAATAASAVAARSNRAEKSENSRRDQTINYEVDRTIQHVQQQAGSVQRLSVAVVVNYQGTDKKGNPKPLSKEQLAQIEILAREAMGYSSARGDSLNVVNTLFTTVENTMSELPFWQQARFFDLLLEMGRYLLVVLVAWIAWRSIVRPQLLKREQALESRQLALAATMKAEGEAQALPPNEPTAEEKLLDKRSRQRLSAEMKVEKLRELARRDPNVVALVIHQWIKKKEEKK